MRKTHWKLTSALAIAISFAGLTQPAAADDIRHLAIMPGVDKVLLDLVTIWGPTHGDATLVTAPRFGVVDSGKYVPGANFAIIGGDDFSYVDGSEKLTVVVSLVQTFTQYSSTATLDPMGELMGGWEEGPGVILGDGEAGSPLFITYNGGISIDITGTTPPGSVGGTTRPPYPPPAPDQPVTTATIATMIDLHGMARVEIRQGVGGGHEIRAVYVNPDTSLVTGEWRTVDLNTLGPVSIWLTKDLLGSSFPDLTLRFKALDDDGVTVLFRDDFFGLEGTMPTPPLTVGAGLLDPTATFVNALAFGSVEVWWTTAAAAAQYSYEDLAGGTLTSPWSMEPDVVPTYAASNWVARTDISSIGTDSSRVTNMAATGSSEARLAFDVDMTDVDLDAGESMALATGTTDNLNVKVFDVMVQNLGGYRRIWARALNSATTVVKTPVMIFDPEVKLHIGVRWVKSSTNQGQLALVVNGVSSTVGSFSTPAGYFLRGAHVGPAYVVLNSGSPSRLADFDRILLLKP